MYLHEVVAGNSNLKMNRMPLLGADLVELKNYTLTKFQEASEELNSTKWDLRNPEHLDAINSLSSCCRHMELYLDRVSKFDGRKPWRQMKIGSKFD